MQVVSNNAVTTIPGRKDKDGQEKVVEMKPMKDGMSNLLQLKERAVNAAKDFNDAVKGVAEKSGLLAKSVRGYVNAKYKDRVDEHAREVEQLSMVFDEMDDSNHEITKATTGDQSKH